MNLFMEEDKRIELSPYLGDGQVFKTCLCPARYLPNGGRMRTRTPLFFKSDPLSRRSQTLSDYPSM